jgi:hypothetical protein
MVIKKGNIITSGALTLSLDEEEKKIIIKICLFI